MKVLKAKEKIVSPKFVDKTREVYLVGEAFFDVEIKISHLS